MTRIAFWMAAMVAPTTAALALPPIDQPATAAVPATPSPFGAAPRIGGADLAKITGRADTAMEIRAQNTSTVSHNSVNGISQTGGIAFDERAFANLSGLSVLSANTGNNVAINSSLNLNIAIRP